MLVLRSEACWLAPYHFFFLSKAKRSLESFPFAFLFSFFELDSLLSLYCCIAFVRVGGAAEWILSSPLSTFLISKETERASWFLLLILLILLPPFFEPSLLSTPPNNNDKSDNDASDEEEQESCVKGHSNRIHQFRTSACIWSLTKEGPSLLFL